MKTLNARKKAILAGEYWYVPEQPCKKCGKIAPRRTDNGLCRGCHPLKRKGKTPRQMAQEAGEKYYLPTHPCRKCGNITLRRVSNGLCLGCHPEMIPTSLQPTVKDDEIMSRDEAFEKGYMHYRTGVPCSRCGIAGKRYVKSGNCAECHKVFK